jgi:FKBP-type peptidyl-prolyl cis-trans isomerase
MLLLRLWLVTSTGATIFAAGFAPSPASPTVLLRNVQHHRKRQQQLQQSSRQLPPASRSCLKQSTSSSASSSGGGGSPFASAAPPSPLQRQQQEQQQQLPDGIVKTVMTPSTGRRIKLGDIVTVKYTCYLPSPDGKGISSNSNNYNGKPFAKATRQKMVSKWYP